MLWLRVYEFRNFESRVVQVCSMPFLSSFVPTCKCLHPPPATLSLKLQVLERPRPLAQMCEDRWGKTRLSTPSTGTAWPQPEGEFVEPGTSDPKGFEGHEVIKGVHRFSGSGNSGLPCQAQQAGLNENRKFPTLVG